MRHPRRLVVCATLFVCALAVTAQEKPPAEVEKAHDELIYTLAVSPDGKTLASGSYDKTIKLWSLPALKFVKELKGHTGQVYCVAYNKDGSLLASGATDKTIRIWDMAKGETGKELKGHTDGVDCIAFSPDGKYIASGSGKDDKSVRLWNVSDGKEAKNLGKHAGTVFGVAFSPDGKYLASCGGTADKLIKVYDMAMMKEIKQIKGHEDGINGIVFSNDSKQIISISLDKTIRIWNVADGKEVKKMGPTEDDPYGLALSKDGKTLATSGYGGWVYVWDLTVKKEEDTPAAAGTRKLLETKISPEYKAAKFEDVVAGLTKDVKGLKTKWDAKKDAAGKPITYKAKDKPVAEVLSDVCKEAGDLGWYVISKKGDTDDGAVLIHKGDERGQENKPVPPLFSKKLKVFGAFCVVFTPDGKSLITGHEKRVKEKDTHARLIVTPIGK